MEGKISTQELNHMWRDDPLAAAVWERRIQQGKAVLTESEQSITVLTGGNHPGTIKV
jgi:hypothetical protein